MRKKIFTLMVLICMIMASNIFSATRYTSLLDAASYGTVDDIKELIDTGADVNSWQYLATRLSMANPDKNGVIRLLYSASDIGWFDGWMARIYAREYIDGAEIIKDIGSYVNAQIDDKITALELAVHFNGDPEVIRTLIETGADVNAKDDDGWTSLMHAAEDNYKPEVIRILVNHGADVALNDNSGKTALEYIKDNDDLKNTDAYWILNDAYYSQKV